MMSLIATPKRRARRLAIVCDHVESKRAQQQQTLQIFSCCSSACESSTRCVASIICVDGASAFGDVWRDKIRAVQKLLGKINDNSLREANRTQFHYMQVFAFFSKTQNVPTYTRGQRQILDEKLSSVSLDHKLHIDDVSHFCIISSCCVMIAIIVNSDYGAAMSLLALALVSLHPLVCVRNHSTNSATIMLSVCFSAVNYKQSSLCGHIETLFFL